METKMMSKRSKLSLDDVFSEVMKSMHFALVFVGAPHKGKAPGRVTKQIVHRSF
jgi:hypothetical protein